MPPAFPRRRFLAATLLVPALARGQTHPGRSDGRWRIGGTGAGLGPLQRLADDLGLRQLHFVPSLGTSGGLKALAAGAIDLALSARPLRDDERAQGLVAQPLFRTPIIWAAHEAVPQRQLGAGTLAALYSGRTSTWSDGTPVRLVLRPESDADTVYLRSLDAEMAEAVRAAHARPGVHLATTDIDAVDALERIPGAFGLTTLGLVQAQQRRLRVMRLAGVPPGIDTLADGRYPHGKTVHLATRGAPAGGLAAALQALTAAPAAQALAAIGCRLGASA